MATNNDLNLSRARELEIALFEKIDTRLDQLSNDMKDVRERVIRIEAQDVSARMVLLEQRVTALEKWQSRITGQVALIVVPIAATVGVVIKILFDVLAK